MLKWSQEAQKYIAEKIFDFSKNKREKNYNVIFKLIISICNE